MTRLSTPTRSLIVGSVRRARTLTLRVDAATRSRSSAERRREEHPLAHLSTLYARKTEEKRYGSDRQLSSGRPPLCLFFSRLSVWLRLASGSASRLRGFLYPI